MPSVRVKTPHIHGNACAEETLMRLMIHATLFTVVHKSGMYVNKKIL